MVPFRAPINAILNPKSGNPKPFPFSSETTTALCPILLSAASNDSKPHLAPIWTEQNRAPSSPPRRYHWREVMRGVHRSC
ncbi:hypothetical protein E1A91_D04G201400v1 [Gossypium mustelinum]|uniref:Uncharacterized protein n=1 Tax=Gossypium mustelinum TaxID=34275 RepID=A0A5D2VG15_GOSMU|nr:hypothetical protein E1A91_D04G201400v1 [Gossypium mustelinum]